MGRVISLLVLLVQLFRFSDFCSQNRRLISGNTYRVQDEFITANRETPQHRATDARLGREAWCATYNLYSQRPYLNISFNTLVNVTSLFIGGASRDSVDYFVTQFQVQVNGEEGNTFVSVKSASNSDTFTRHRSTAVQEIQLPNPVSTRVLFVRALEWSPRNVTCMRIEAKGCLARPACLKSTLLSTSSLLQSVKASSPIPSNGLNRLVDNGTEWCERRVGTAPYFTLIFSHPVILTHMRVSGYNHLGALSYVRRYRLEIRNGSDSFTYGLIFAPSSANLTTMTLWQPVRGRVFRIHVLDFKRTSDSLLCWKIRLFGCIYSDFPNLAGNSEATQSDAATTTTSEENIILSTGTVPSSSNNPATTTGFIQFNTTRAQTISAFTTSKLLSPEENALNSNMSIESTRASSNSSLVLPLVAAVTGSVILLIVMAVFLAIFLIFRLKAKSKVALDNLNDSNRAEALLDNNIIVNDNDAYGSSTISQNQVIESEMADPVEEPPFQYELDAVNNMEANNVNEGVYDDIV